MRPDSLQKQNFDMTPWIKTILIGLLTLNIISIVILSSVPPVSRERFVACLAHTHLARQQVIEIASI